MKKYEIFEKNITESWSILPSNEDIKRIHLSNTDDSDLFNTSYPAFRYEIAIDNFIIRILWIAINLEKKPKFRIVLFVSGQKALIEIERYIVQGRTPNPREVLKSFIGR